VLHAKGGSATPDNQMNSLRKSIPENIAVKVFKTVMSEFRHRDKYIQDDYRFCDRFKKLNSKKVSAPLGRKRVSKSRTTGIRKNTVSRSGTTKKTHTLPKIHRKRVRHRRKFKFSRAQTIRIK